MKEFVEHNWRQFLWHKFTNLPTWKDARYWKSVLGGNPLTPEEWASFARMIDENHAITMNNHRKRSLLGWYFREWQKWLCFWSLKNFNDGRFDQHCWEEIEEKNWQREQAGLIP